VSSLSSLIGGIPGTGTVAHAETTAPGPAGTRCRGHRDSCRVSRATGCTPGPLRQPGPAPSGAAAGGPAPAAAKPAAGAAKPAWSSAGREGVQLLQETPSRKTHREAEPQTRK